MNVVSDISLVSQKRRARMEACANADRSSRQLLTYGCRGFQSAWCGRKRDKERVALRVDLDAPARAYLLTHDPPMLGEGVCVLLLAELAEKPRRALDVSEEERDGPGRDSHDQGSSSASTASATASSGASVRPCAHASANAASSSCGLIIANVSLFRFTIQR